MLSKFNFKKQIFGINTGNFNALAVDLFHYQASHNTIYRDYLNLLHISSPTIQAVEDIPFMPIGFFKSHKILTGDETAQVIFKSSGTTRQTRSNHYVPDPDFYAQISIRIFEQAYGSLSNYIILSLLPSYLENKDSSLVYMVHKFMERANSSLSGFITRDSGEYLKKVYAQRGEKKIILLGVTYALLDFVTENTLQMPDVVVMETGGMKGMGVERPREEVHQILKQYFNVPHIHSEYGMTELLSQAYAYSEGVFQIPFTMKVFTREINDPLTLNDQKSPGALNIIDLANVDSCAFIATEDLGKLNEDGTFVVSGRIDNSELRGCNLLSVG